MAADRYVKIILTIIAVELFWLGLHGTARPVSAQQAGATPVVIRGIDLNPDASGYLPVALVGSYRAIPENAVRRVEPLVTRISGAVNIQASTPLKVGVEGPVVVETRDRPLIVRNVGYTPSERPGPPGD